MTIKDIVNRDIINLTNCDQEPIHIPGSIQPQGFLLGIDLSTFHILFCSGNVQEFLDFTHQQLLGKSIDEVFGKDLGQELRGCTDHTDGRLKILHMVFGDKDFELSVHAHAGYLIVESEAKMSHEQEKQDLLSLSKEFLGYMEETHTLKQLCTLVARGIRHVTGYDRVMIYRFDKDYNGEVIAESKRDDLEGFLGLHYPHTDIPPQARELYIKNQLRIIADVNYMPVPLYTIDDGKDRNLDLSYASLRSVSPIHVQYLHNMGVGATLTISLIHKKKLWGLVACHHYSPKYLSQETRLAAKLQGNFITSQIDVRQLNEEYEATQKINDAAKRLISRKLELDRNSFAEVTGDPDLLLLCNASGVSLLIDNHIYKAGITPDDNDIRQLAAYLSVYTGNTQFHTDSIGKLLPESKSYAGKIPGVNYVSLNISSNNCIIWYKPETIAEVNWAGDPAKAIEKDKNGLSPRKSFELWKETLKFQSNPWLQSEIAASSNFASVLLKHMGSVFLAEEEEKQRELARILMETNAELENINWISTHDLQEPLRKIQMMSSFILSEEEKEIPEDVYEKVLRMNKSAERMQVLVKDILKYTRLNYSKEAFEDIDLGRLLEEVAVETNDSLMATEATLTIGKLPEVKGVSFLLKQLFSNLIYNSLKFSHADRRPQLSVALVEGAFVPDLPAGKTDEYHVIRYSDNGIGFEKNYNESVFNIFTRLNNTGEYQGSGIGLALCKKIMNTHKGIIKADGRPGEGVDFFIYFPKTNRSI